MAKTPIDLELDRFEADTGKSRSQLFREWFKDVSFGELIEMYKPKKEPSE